jgi:hypothetical protein
MKLIASSLSIALFLKQAFAAQVFIGESCQRTGIDWLFLGATADYRVAYKDFLPTAIDWAI